MQPHSKADSGLHSVAAYDMVLPVPGPLKMVPFCPGNVRIGFREGLNSENNDLHGAGQ
jgi:hypothetical protein